MRRASRPSPRRKGRSDRLSEPTRLRAQDDFQCRSQTRLRRQREPALDALRPRPDVLQALARRGVLTVEALAVVVDRDETLPVDALADHDLGTRCVRMFAHVSQALLHDAEYLDLLVRRQPHGWIDLELDRRAWETRSEEHTSELQSRQYLVCRLLLEKKKKK